MHAGSVGICCVFVLWAYHYAGLWSIRCVLEEGSATSCDEIENSFCHIFPGKVLYGLVPGNWLPAHHRLARLVLDLCMTDSQLPTRRLENFKRSRWDDGISPFLMVKLTINGNVQ